MSTAKMVGRSRNPDSDDHAASRCGPASLTTSAKGPYSAGDFAVGIFRCGTTILAGKGASCLGGKALLAEKCARCHSIDAPGDSPLKAAPPMRDIYARFAPTELKVELMEGMVSLIGKCRR